MSDIFLTYSDYMILYGFQMEPLTAARAAARSPCAGAAAAPLPCRAPPGRPPPRYRPAPHQELPPPLCRRRPAPTSRTGPSNRGEPLRLGQSWRRGCAEAGPESAPSEGPEAEDSDSGEAGMVPGLQTASGLRLGGGGLRGGAAYRESGAGVAGSDQQSKQLTSSQSN